MLRLGAVFMLLTFVVFAGYGVCAAAVREHVIGPATGDRAGCGGGFAASFVALGARLARRRSQ